MRHFYLHLVEQGRIIHDDEGRSCADLAEARRLAIAALRDVAAADVLKGTLDTGMTMQVCDGSDSVLAIISFAEAVTVQAPERAPA